MLRNAALSLLGALPLLVAVPACFEVEKVDPGPFYIDTFENESPRVASFERWRCDPLNGQGTGGVEDPIQDVSCMIQLFGGHPTALTTVFELHESLDDTKPAAGVSVSTTIPNGGTVDLSAFQQLVFFATVDSGEPPLPSGTQLTVEIECAFLRAGDSVSQTVSQTVSNLGIGSNWRDFRLELDDFLPIGRPCLQRTNSIRFLLRPGLRNGLAASGTLSLDDIFLR